MENIINILLMVDAGLLIILVLLQSGKSDGLSAAFTGSGDLNLFAVQKERGPESDQPYDTGLWHPVFVLVISLQII